MMKTRAIAGGWAHSLVVREDGTVIAWGRDDAYQTNVPSGLTNVAAVAAGWSHNVALLSNSTVRAWGINYSSYGWNVATPPAGLSNVVAIAAGGYHTLALRSNGTVVAWGAGNGTNLSLDYLGEERNQSVVPVGLSNVIAVAAGDKYSMALRNDGIIVAWGDNAYGQTNLIPGLNNVVRISAGTEHGLAVRGGRLTPFITQQPNDQYGVEGTNLITFSAAGIGLAAVHYQWQFGGVDISGATNQTLNLTNAVASQEGEYRVIVSTGAGSVTSSVAQLRLITPPVITSISQPTSQVAVAYTDVALGVTATAPYQWLSPISYVWQLNGTNALTGYGSNRTVLVKESTAGDYTLTLTNLAGSTSATWHVGMTYTGSYIAPDTLAYHLSTNAAAHTNGFTGSYDDRLELSGWHYADYYPTNLSSLTNSVWSTNFWLASVRGLSATPIGKLNGTGGQGLATMVSPRHYLCATHMHPENNPLAFLDTNNVIHWRSTLERVDIGSDISVGILDTNLPSEVGFLPVVPTNVLDYLPTNAAMVVQGIGMNQFMRVFSQPITLNTTGEPNWDSTFEIPFGVATNWSEPVVGGLV